MMTFYQKLERARELHQGLLTRREMALALIEEYFEMRAAKTQEEMLDELLDIAVVAFRIGNGEYEGRRDKETLEQTKRPVFINAESKKFLERAVIRLCVMLFSDEDVQQQAKTVSALAILMRETNDPRTEG